ncbi:MAG: flagellar biosynthetic protein FliR [Defluviitaleaceae bacterium]|nr:flagellar biosynthetic protein FliR [Defluviitaleaceae bacterium]
MNDSFPYFLEVFANAPIFLLILMRMLGFFIIMPVFAANSIPAMVRVFFSISFAFIVYISELFIVADVVYFGESIWGAFFLLLTEFLIGFAQAYIVFIVFSAIYLAGQFIEQNIGYNQLTMFDPISGFQAPVFGNLLYMTAMVILIITGNFNRILLQLFSSFIHVPIGTVSFLNNAVSIHMINVIINSFYMGVQIAMPFIGSMLVLNIALGIMVKIIPQLNVFVVGIPIRILVGLVILVFIVPLFSSVFTTLFNEAYRAIQYLIFFLEQG